MNYSLQGHDRDNGVQELLISLLPDEPHNRVESLEGEGCLSRAWQADGQICASAEIFRGERHTQTQVCQPAPAEEDPEAAKKPAADDPTASAAPGESSAPFNWAEIKTPLMIGGLVLVLAIGGAFALKKFRERR